MIEDQYYRIEDAPDTLQSWKEIESLSSETKKLIQPAKILFIPWRFNRSGIDSSFPVKTEEFYSFFKERMENKEDVEICVNENEYKELALHADYIWLGSIIVSSIIVPVFVNLLSEYLKNRLLKNDSTNIIQIDVIIDCRSINKEDTKKFSYKKPLSEFEQFKKDIISYSKCGEIEKNKSLGKNFDEIG